MTKLFASDRWSVADWHDRCFALYSTFLGPDGQLQRRGLPSRDSNERSGNIADQQHCLLREVFPATRHQAMAAQFPWQHSPSQPISTGTRIPGTIRYATSRYCTSGRVPVPVVQAAG